MDFLRRMSTFAVLILVFLFSGCDSSEDDNSTTTEPVYESIEGTWSFTLSPQKENEGSADQTENVVLYESNGVITGYVEFFTIHGTRSGNNLAIDVYRPTGEGSYSHETTMQLTLTDDDEMTGSGTLTYPEIEVYIEPDSTINPKFTVLHEDWDGGAGSVHFYNVTALKLGTAPTMASVISSEFPERYTTINWCSLLAGLSRVPLFILTGSSDSRPFGDCGLSHDGGGSYLSGRTGPGTKYPFLTTTEYYAYEYSWCHVRGYSFHIRIKGEIDHWNVIDQIRDNGADAFLPPQGMSIEDYIAGFEDFHSKYGGFAVCTGYSMRTGNMSVYLLTTRNINKTDILKNPWMQAVYNDLINGMDQGSIWTFAGKEIHDSWQMRRSLSGVCNSYIDYTYIVGTHEVNFD